MKKDDGNNGKLITLAIVSLFLAAMFSIGFPVQPAKADGDSIYIRADGSVDPPTARILRVGEIYTLTADVTESIVIEKDNIMVDGAGHTVQGVGEWRGAGLSLSQRDNVTVCNFKVTGFSTGILVHNSTNSRVLRNILASCDYGVVLGLSYKNSVLSNNATNNAYAGIYLYSSAHNIVMNNIALNNRYGIYLYSSDYNRVFNSVASNNEYGIRMVYSGDCNFCWNNVTNNWYGIFLNSPPSALSSFILLENDISSNDVGLWLWASSGNTIYHNNFFNNFIQVSLHNSYNNNWDNGFEGNYWSDYHGSDADNDGIGDEPYIIDENDQDTYPLMARIIGVRAVKPLLFWFEWWFWGICALAVATVVLLRKYAQQRKAIETYKRQLGIFPEVSHLDRARMLFRADVDRRRGKIEEFGKKYGVRIRRVEDSFEDALERLGIERKREE